MQFFTFILAALMSVFAAAQNATVFDQSFCSGQPQVSGGYTYNSSNPFPISTLAQPTGGAATAVGTGGMAAPTGNATYVSMPPSASLPSTFSSFGSVTSALTSVADATSATAAIAPTRSASNADSSSSSSGPNSTASIEPFTGAASSNRFEVVSALGGFGAFAVVAALL
ncbi:hypothetical protein D0869_07274 [Hortaea werneckii]|uniref:REJ domain-containing protein n=1 Tax=Hortaea werneckii TaxID=91943 RepID=A0A3M6WRK0_HORWE|nr:hypothetical protein D0869_07274 [Hortaea werneckii]RMX99011.1 hypothetical protein D0868_09768 [Hortaea werneckii]RMY12856.1 hypothetical protein D0866_14155 [Hortaea werneckii]RMY17670.1 hypothetical protein D0867_05871 [Hortaea werneckii]